MSEEVSQTVTEEVVVEERDEAPAEEEVQSPLKKYEITTGISLDDLKNISEMNKEKLVELLHEGQALNHNFSSQSPINGAYFEMIEEALELGSLNSRKDEILIKNDTLDRDFMVMRGAL